MNRKALIFTVKWLLEQWRKAPVVYFNATRPTKCELCRRPAHSHSLHYIAPRSSWRAGRGKWVCTHCLYPGDPLGLIEPDVGYKNTVDDALRFRDYGQSRAPTGHRNLRAIWSNYRKNGYFRDRP